MDQNTFDITEDMFRSLEAKWNTAREQRNQLEALIVDAHFRAFGARHYAYVDPRSACDLLVADIAATQHERDALLEQLGQANKTNAAAWDMAHKLRDYLRETQADRNRLREALEEMRLRALFVGHPGEAFHDRGDGVMVPDWRDALAKCEAALNPTSQSTPKSTHPSSASTEQPQSEPE